MTTKLSKPITRQTYVTIRDAGKARELIITLSGDDIVLRLKGLKTSYRVPMEDVYWRGVKLANPIMNHLKRKR